jgi:hypothetical protein
MNERVLKYLFDIKLSLDEIDSFLIGREKRFESYKRPLAESRD